MAHMVPQIAVILFALQSSASSVLAATTVAPPPDLSGMWGRNSFDFEPASSGPSPVMNVRRLPNGAIDQRTSVGDYKNPILKPQAAEIVRKRGDVSQNGTIFPDPSNQCAPYSPPYSHSIALQLQILRQQDEILIMYPQDQGVRHIRLDQIHPTNPSPSWYGDSVGHYEGDTLVVDTVGLKVGPLAMVDRYGTPYGRGIHLTERFRLIDGGAAQQATAKHEKEFGRVGGPPGVVKVDPMSDKGLEVSFTIDDPEMFNTPWSASVTYSRVTDEWLEYVCAENPNLYFGLGTSGIPQADRPDF